MYLKLDHSGVSFKHVSHDAQPVRAGDGPRHRCGRSHWIRSIWVSNAQESLKMRTTGWEELWDFLPTCFWRLPSEDSLSKGDKRRKGECKIVRCRLSVNDVMLVFMTSAYPQGAKYEFIFSYATACYCNYYTCVIRTWRKKATKKKHFQSRTIKYPNNVQEKMTYLGAKGFAPV